MNTNTNKKIFFEKLFPWKYGVQRSNLKMSYECISYVTVFRDSAKIIQHMSEHMANYKKNIKEVSIIDANACVGCDTVSFCDAFSIVIPIEINKERYGDLLHNLNIYNIANAYPINGNCLEKIDDININIDIIYFDPPWGGSDYKLEKKINIKLNNLELYEIVEKYINKTKLIVFKLPKNFDYDIFTDKLKHYKIAIYKDIKKLDIVIIEK